MVVCGAPTTASTRTGAQSAGVGRYTSESLSTHRVPPLSPGSRQFDRDLWPSSHGPISSVKVLSQVESGRTDVEVSDRVGCGISHPRCENGGKAGGELLVACVLARMNSVPRQRRDVHLRYVQLVQLSR
ncbi:hypothetical protein BV22DRAFT_754217 [Leucogyrophana mollusca]|uniref:Uncharacterized protein n=1 Tax=Leucogyrophana mollusca TaxID=85980 RepID=A0ACB8B5Q5_9AGAM|nr:hypothetical protein BV22DRAFT_754217 [Leucogyrophana mollusca]